EADAAGSRGRDVHHLEPRHVRRRGVRRRAEPAAGRDPRRRRGRRHAGRTRRRGRRASAARAHAHARPPCGRRRRRRRVPAHGEAARRGARARTVTAGDPRVWYFVRELDRGRDFYKRLLGFEETYVDWDDRWAKLEREAMRIALSEA